MKLILTRHAKSDWDGMCSDHERPLSRRGTHAAPLIGQYLRDHGHVPDQAIVSDAVRTRETFALVADQFSFKIPVHFDPRLYHASATTMLKVLQKARGQTILMVGHNPGIAAFAEGMVSAPPKHTRFFDYPTCATTVMAFETTDISEVQPASGVVLDFVIPREL